MAWMVNCRTGRMVAELAWPALPGSGCRMIRGLGSVRPCGRARSVSSGSAVPAAWWILPSWIVAVLVARMRHDDTMPQGNRRSYPVGVALAALGDGRDGCASLGAPGACSGRPAGSGAAGPGGPVTRSHALDCQPTGWPDRATVRRARSGPKIQPQPGRRQQPAAVCAVGFPARSARICGVWG